MVKNLLKISGLLVVAAVSVLIIFKDQEIRDWWYLQNYVASADILSLAETSGMSEAGREKFYVSDPQINNKETFNQNCSFQERTIVLGCYNGKQIYILDIDDPKLDGVMSVTAAHEMLHAVYMRLSSDEKTKIDKLLNEQFAKVKEDRILKIVYEYDKNDQALINNELHSILPTELDELDPELEEYYSQFFDDRQKVVQAAKNYEEVFVELEDKLSSLQSQIDSLKVQITASDDILSQLSGEISSERTVLESLEAEKNYEEYNSLVPGFNEKVGRYNNQIQTQKELVTQHNNLVEEINATTIQHNQLVNTIDSKYEPI